jgi:hypothetical protein
MPFGEVKLIPGVNTERTPTLNEAGVSQSQLIRYKDSLIQKYGGWQLYYPFATTTIPRDLHGWVDLQNNDHLSIGATNGLSIITNGALNVVTPQQLVSDTVPNLSTVGNSPTVTIVDPNISNVTTFDSIYIQTPLSIGGLVLSGIFPIQTIVNATSYTITAPNNANVTAANPTTTNATTAAGNPTLHFAATPSWLVSGMAVFDITSTTAIPPNTIATSSTASTVLMTNNATASGVGSGDSIVFCSIPYFTTTLNSAVVNVLLVGHGLSVGSTVVFPVSTTANGVTISSNHTVVDVVDANNFQIIVSTQATATGSFLMNGGLAQILYYINLGPTLAGQGYGLGNYGAGLYGFGTSGGTSQVGTPITATDWTQDNWGEILLACPMGGGVYQFDPTGGFSNAGLVPTAPPLNGGIFVSNSQQILICWGSTESQNIGIEQDPMLVKWSTVGDYTQFQVLATNQAGSFRIPIGSKIMAGMAVAQQDLIWTDLDCWAMNYQGPPFVFGFNTIGAGAGAISSHSVQKLRGNVYWMGNNNFYAFTGSGVNVLPCPVWDFVFQNLNTSFVQNVRSMPNTPFNEAGWLFPSKASTTGECDSYVKMNITEPNAPWDYGSINRTAWMDQTALGMPIGADAGGFIYLQETTPDANGSALNASFNTGYFMIAEGEDFAVVDQVIPDMKWGLYPGTGSASLLFTFFLVDYPGDTPRVFGPFTVVQGTERIDQRMRGRQMAIQIQSLDQGSFWRLGRIRFRYAPSGRR